MNKGFTKFKRKLRAEALLSSAVFGISSGVFVSALTALITKLSGSVPNPLIYICIGGACALILTALLLAVQLPSDRRVAKRLDSKLKLDEKVQTMVAFSGNEGDVIEVQRRDTERILDSIPVKALKSGHVWVHFIMPILAVIILTVAILVPGASAENPPIPDTDPDFTLSAWQEQALIDLIEEVKKSEMENVPKEKTLSELEGLLKALRATQKVSTMKASVIGVIQRINEAVDGHNSYISISESLKKSDSETLKGIASAIETLSALTLGEELGELRTLANEDNISDPKGPISSTALEINSLLSASEISAGDPLYASLNKFADDLLEAISGTDTLTHEDLGKELDSIFSSSGSDISAALLIQYTNERVGDNAVLRLMSIFGISASEIPEGSRPGGSSTSDGEGDYKPEDNDDPLHSGGFGSGDMVFGSDDMIYDPELGKYVTYGEVINKYYAEITEHIVDGNVSEELEKLLTDYFASLFNGSDKDEKQTTKTTPT